MAAVRHQRTRARRVALQMLYAGLLNETDPVALIHEGLTPDPTMVIDAYAESLVKGVGEQCDDLDAYIRDASENWAVERMPIVDKCILRIAVYEMLNVDEVPAAVSINEAVMLAKEFGGEDDSHRFVNGVLGQIATRLGASVAQGDDGEDDLADSADDADGCEPSVDEWEEA